MIKRNCDLTSNTKLGKSYYFLISSSNASGIMKFSILSLSNPIQPLIDILNNINKK